MHLKSPNLIKIETLANFIYYGGIPEYVKQLIAGEKQADLFADSIKKLLTTDNDFNPVYDGIRKLNVIGWMLQ